MHKIRSEEFKLMRIHPSFHPVAKSRSSDYTFQCHWKQNSLLLHMYTFIEDYMCRHRGSPGSILREQSPPVTSAMAVQLYIKRSWSFTSLPDLIKLIAGFSTFIIFGSPAAEPQRIQKWRFCVELQMCY